MIDVVRQLPYVYFAESRDFQVLARAYEVTYNYLKTNVDAMEHLTFDSAFDRSLLEMMALTIGFSTRHEYDQDDLMAVCSCFAELLRYKGSKKAIETAIMAVLNAQHIKGEVWVETEYKMLGGISGDKSHLIIYIPRVSVDDIVLLEDIMDYVLPAGMTYTFTNVNPFGGVGSIAFGTEDVHVGVNKPTSKMGTVTKFDGAVPDRFTTDNNPDVLSQTSTGAVVSGVPSEE